MQDRIAEEYMRDVIARFHEVKFLAGKAIAQVSDDELFVQIDAESNSIAIIIQHIAGNMRSRWTDFLTSDGEKPDRQRDREFERRAEVTRETLLEEWEAGWRCLFAAIEPLQTRDLCGEVMIRGEKHSVIQAINRQLAHYASHAGQIVFLAKHLRGKKWKTLSIPRGKSEAFNQAMREGRQH